MPPRAVLVEGFASLDEFDLRTVFQRRAVVMRTVPPILRGQFRNTLRVAMDEAIGGIEVLMSCGTGEIRLATTVHHAPEQGH